MQGQGDDVDFPFAWLWNNNQLADVSFVVEFNEADSLPSPQSQSGASLSSSAVSPIQVPDKVIDAGNTELDGEKASSAAAGAGKIDGSTSASTEKTYLLHSQLLSSTSAFFRASLTTEVGEPSHKKARTENTFRWQLHAKMCGGDADAVEAVLFSLYKPQEYDEAVASELLIRIMKVADLWQAQKTAAAASKALCSRTDSFPLSAAFSLPAGLATSASFAALLVAAETVLLLRFGNARTVIDSPALLQQLLELPFAALHALLHSPELVTDAEATVLLLFSSWCEGAAGKACTEQQLQQLNEGIRYSCLSTPYLTELSQHLHSPKLTQGQLMELLHFRSIPTQLNPQEECELDGPEGWYLPNRPPSPAHLITTLTLDVTEADVKLTLAAAADSTTATLEHSSAAVYSSGFLWVLKLRAHGGELGPYVYPFRVSLNHEKLQKVALKHGIVCDLGIRIKQPEQLVLFSMEETLLGAYGYGMCMSNKVTHEGSFPDSAGIDWWERFMVDGRVQLRADIRNIAE